MAFDAAGTFTRYGGSTIWQGDALAGTKILSDRHDAHDQEIANGLSECLTRSGKGAPTVDISWGSKRLINLGAPTADTDAATKSYVDTFKSFTTGSIITGADLNGRVTFSSPTGANGLSWTGADLSWLARLATTTPAVTINRLVLNDKADGTGTDVATIDEAGNATFNGAMTSSGIVGGSVVAAKGSSGNVHFWFYGPDNADRGVIYTDAGSQQPLHIRNAVGYDFTFNNSGQFAAPGNVYAGGAFLETNGNVQGSLWDNWGAHDAFTAISAQIESRATAWANNRVSSLSYRKVSEGSVGTTAVGVHRAPDGAVVTALIGGSSNTISAFYYHYLQVYDPVRGWVGFTG